MIRKLLLDGREAAEMLSISLRSLERLAANGQLPSVKVGGLRRYHVRDVEEFADSLREPIREVPARIA